MSDLADLARRMRAADWSSALADERLWAEATEAVEAMAAAVPPLAGWRWVPVETLEAARAALSDLLLKRDPIVYSDALRALDEALETSTQVQGAGPGSEA